MCHPLGQRKSTTISSSNNRGKIQSTTSHPQDASKKPTIGKNGCSVRTSVRRQAANKLDPPRITLSAQNQDSPWSKSKFQASEQRNLDPNGWHLNYVVNGKVVDFNEFQQNQSSNESSSNESSSNQSVNTDATGGTNFNTEDSIQVLNENSGANSTMQPDVSQKSPVSHVGASKLESTTITRDKSQLTAVSPFNSMIGTIFGLITHFLSKASGVDIEPEQLKRESVGVQITSTMSELSAPLGIALKVPALSNTINEFVSHIRDRPTGNTWADGALHYNFKDGCVEHISGLFRNSCDLMRRTVSTGVGTGSIISRSSLDVDALNSLSEANLGIAIFNTGFSLYNLLTIIYGTSKNQTLYDRMQKRVDNVESKNITFSKDFQKQLLFLQTLASKDYEYRDKAKNLKCLSALMFFVFTGASLSLVSKFVPQVLIATLFNGLVLVFITSRLVEMAEQKIAKIDTLNSEADKVDEEWKNLIVLKETLEQQQQILEEQQKVMESNLNGKTTHQQTASLIRLQHQLKNEQNKVEEKFKTINEKINDVNTRVAMLDSKDLHKKLLATLFPSDDNDHWDDETLNFLNTMTDKTTRSRVTKMIFGKEPSFHELLRMLQIKRSEWRHAIGVMQTGSEEVKKTAEVLKNQRETEMVDILKMITHHI